MARKLKTYITSLGFFEHAIAAPSMKAALEAWGADSNLFHQGAAKESTDPDVVAATMKKPGVVLKRPARTVRSASMPNCLRTSAGTQGRKARRRRKAKKPSAKPDKAADRKAAQAYERERQRREREENKEEAARQKARERRQLAIDKAQAAPDDANAQTLCAPKSRRSSGSCRSKTRIGTSRSSG